LHKFSKRHRNKVVARSAHRAVVKHAIEDWTVCLSHWPQVEAAHLQNELVLVVWCYAIEEVDIICSKGGVYKNCKRRVVLQVSGSFNVRAIHVLKEDMSNISAQASKLPN
jgi:hypothetical protein